METPASRGTGDSPSDPDVPGRVTTRPEPASGHLGTPPAVEDPSLTRRGRIRKWDRPPPPHDWRWYVGTLGKILIALGILMFGFVGYQLWGTGLETARAQSALESDFDDLLAAVPPVDVGDSVSAPDGEPEDEAPATAPDDGVDPAGPDTSDPLDTDPLDTGPVIPVDDQNIPLLENGDALARIEIPAIDVDDIVVAGVDTSALKKGPGHFPDTPLPGQLGNSAIAGHRTTYGQPFHDVDQLVPGDEIRMTTLTGIYVYRVTGTRIVSPSDYQVVATTDPTVATLTLTSCHPKWTARERIVISSELDRAASAPVGEPVLDYGRSESDSAASVELPAGGEGEGEEVEVSTTEGDAAVDAGSQGGASDILAELTTGDVDQLGTAPIDDGIADAFSDGWFSDPSANPQVGLWGAALAAIALGAYAISRKLRRDWAGALVGIVPFVIALYFFFQNVNRLLPPNL